MVVKKDEKTKKRKQSSEESENTSDSSESTESEGSEDESEETGSASTSSPTTTSSSSDTDIDEKSAAHKVKGQGVKDSNLNSGGKQQQSQSTAEQTNNNNNSPSNNNSNLQSQTNKANGQGRHHVGRGPKVVNVTLKDISPKKPRRRKRKPRALTICLTNCRYEIVRNVARRYALVEVGEDEAWNIYWTDFSVSLERAMDMRRYQLVNHFPGMNEICRKDLLSRNLNRMKRLFTSDYDIFPRTWSLPADLGELQSYAHTRKNKTYICKPEMGCQGRGIFLIRSIKDLNPFGKIICQLYVARPFLIDNLKFDLRIYVLMTTCDPLRIYVYNEGLARFATAKYKPPTNTNTENSYMHLTNYAVNKYSRDFVVDDEGGSKRKLSAVYRWLEQRSYDTDELLNNIDDVIIKTLISAHPILKHNYRTCFPNHDLCSACFEILGFDILLDYKLKPYVLEVNHSPSFHTDAKLDRDIKESLLNDTFAMLNMKQLDIYKVESDDRRRVQERLLNKHPEKKDKPEPANGMSTEDQQFQWELEHCGGYRLVYPSPTSDKYDKYFDQNLSSLYHETAASQARANCTRNQMEEYNKLKQQEEKKRQALGQSSLDRSDRPKDSPVSKDKSVRPESPASPEKPAKAKRKAFRKFRDQFSCFSPSPIVAEEELDRMKSLMQRGMLIRSLGIELQVFKLLCQIGNLKPEEEKIFRRMHGFNTGVSGGVGGGAHITAPPTHHHPHYKYSVPPQLQRPPHSLSNNNNGPDPGQDNSPGADQLQHPGSGPKGDLHFHKDRDGLNLNYYRTQHPLSNLQVPSSNALSWGNTNNNSKLNENYPAPILPSTLEDSRIFNNREKGDHHQTNSTIGRLGPDFTTKNPYNVPYNSPAPFGVNNPKHIKIDRQRTSSFANIVNANSVFTSEKKGNTSPVAVPTNIVTPNLVNLMDKLSVTTMGFEEKGVKAGLVNNSNNPTHSTFQKQSQQKQLNTIALEAEQTAGGERMTDRKYVVNSVHVSHSIKPTSTALTNIHTTGSGRNHHPEENLNINYSSLSSNMTIAGSSARVHPNLVAPEMTMATRADLNKIRRFVCTPTSHNAEMSPGQCQSQQQQQKPTQQIKAGSTGEFQTSRVNNTGHVRIQNQPSLTRAGTVTASNIASINDHQQSPRGAPPVLTPQSVPASNFRNNPWQPPPLASQTKQYPNDPNNLRSPTALTSPSKLFRASTSWPRGNGASFLNYSPSTGNNVALKAAATPSTGSPDPNGPTSTGMAGSALVKQKVVPSPFPQHSSQEEEQRVPSQVAISSQDDNEPVQCTQMFFNNVMFPVQGLAGGGDSRFGCQSKTISNKSNSSNFLRGVGNVALLRTGRNNLIFGSNNGNNKSSPSKQQPSQEDREKPNLFIKGISL